MGHPAEPAITGSVPGPRNGPALQHLPLLRPGELNIYTYVVDPPGWGNPPGLVREPIIFLPKGRGFFHPGTVESVNNPEGPFKIKATGSRFVDKNELYKAAGLNERKSNKWIKWISHHASYEPQKIRC